MHSQGDWIGQTWFPDETTSPLTYEEWKRLRDANSDAGEPIQRSCNCGVCYANYRRTVPEKQG
jgi:hypothetical protein